MQGGTYGGSILGCAAANATIDAIEEDGMLENARDRGVQLVQVGACVYIIVRCPAKAVLPLLDQMGNNRQGGGL